MDEWLNGIYDVWKATQVIATSDTQNIIMHIIISAVWNWKKNHNYLYFKVPNLDQKNHSSRPIILCLSGGRVFATWLCSGQCLARVVLWVFLEVTEQGFRVWHWFMHVYDRLFKCVHIVIFFITSLDFVHRRVDSSSSLNCNICQIIWVT